MGPAQGSRMAYLNVRERRVETTILYIGAEGAGRSTNVEQLGRRATPSVEVATRTLEDGAGDVLAIDWVAPADVQFRDCSLTVRVLAAQGPLSAERTRAMLRAADGVVLVLDARPDAHEDNRISANVVREALADDRRQSVPVVVQVNKTDAPDALPLPEVLAPLDEAWPHVPARAASGEGVVETLERALQGVLESLQAHADRSAGETLAPPHPATSPKAEGNPLLAALRQVLRETVEEHVALLETRFATRLDRELERRFAADTIEVRRGLVEQARALASLERLVHEKHTEARSRAAATAEALDTLGARVTTLAAAVEALGGLTGRTEELAAAIAAVGERVNRTSALAGAIDALGEKVNRTTTLPAAITALGEKINRTNALGAAVEALGEKVDRADKRAEERAARPPKPTGPSAADLEAAAAQIGGRIDALASELKEQADRATERAERTATDVNLRTSEILDELRRREKKSWFR